MELTLANLKRVWITTELFYGWLANHFFLRIPPIRLVLLVNGNSTHIDIEILKLCKEKSILLYCLPAQSSHITQPLDVGSYAPLKQAWKKAVTNYAVDHIGKSVTKQIFAQIFKEAWENTRETKEKFAVRYEEGYYLEKDELYVV